MEGAPVLVASIILRNNGGMRLRHQQGPFVRIDFGTTNSSLAVVRDGSKVELASFPTRGGSTLSYRSVLYLEQVKKAHGAKQIVSKTGPAAIEGYLDAEEKGRLIQSLKSYLPNRNLTGTEIFVRRQTLEALVSRILADLRGHAERQFDMPIRHATVGRPVRFVGAETEDDDAYAEARLRDALCRPVLRASSLRWSLSPRPIRMNRRWTMTS